MAQIAKLEVQTELKANADKLYELFQSKAYLLPEICPEVIKGLKVVKGDCGSVGSIKEWTYCAGGSVSEVSTETIVAIDEKNKSITHQLVEGELQKYYKSFYSTLQFTPKKDGGSSMKWSVKYEKQNESIPAPNKYLDFVVDLSNSIDAYLIKNA